MKWQREQGGSDAEGDDCLVESSGVHPRTPFANVP